MSLILRYDLSRRHARRTHLLRRAKNHGFSPISTGARRDLGAPRAYKKVLCLFLSSRGWPWHFRNSLSSPVWALAFAQGRCLRAIRFLAISVITMTGTSRGCRRVIPMADNGQVVQKVWTKAQPSGRVTGLKGGCFAGGNGPTCALPKWRPRTRAQDLPLCLLYSCRARRKTGNGRNKRSKEVRHSSIMRLQSCGPFGQRMIVSSKLNRTKPYVDRFHGATCGSDAGQVPTSDLERA